ncbi:MAG TPA: aldo/keto reductase [Longimicrobium sp.]|jgi:aryl-alcohol dehydrogenase-like predicted oxidoreductase|uniref:aldo/keto reductase n=1 Tax=Longimicrobium sp. TaxID=2029185 RepID=UPI002ED7874D
MEATTLGRGGPRVSRVGMGALPLSWEGRPPRDAAVRVVHRALEVGVTLFDTADSYCLHAGETGHNERLLRDALAAHPAGRGAVVATKGGVARVGGRLQIDGHPWYLRRACEASLRALGVETIDLYQLHAPDPRVPFAESVGALARLRDEGKVRAVGVSNVSPAQLEEALAVVPVAAVQNRLNPWDRGAARSGLLALCGREGIAFLAHSPLGGAERVARLRRSAALGEVAARHGASPAELVLAWLMAMDEAVVPIPGASRPESVESSARAAALRLDDEARAALEAAFAPAARAA